MDRWLAGGWWMVDNGRMGDWTNGRLDEWATGRMGDWTNGRTMGVDLVSSSLQSLPADLPGAELHSNLPPPTSPPGRPFPQFLEPRVQLLRRTKGQPRSGGGTTWHSFVPIWREA